MDTQTIIFSDWTKTNTGIFYQLNRVKTLPFTDDTATIANLDQDFLLENANKEMFTDDTATIVNSVLAAYYHQWQDLTAFYKSIEPGITSEIVSSNTTNEQNQNQMALSDSTDMFTTSGINSDTTAQTSTKTKDYSGYKDFLLSNDFYAIIKSELRNYLFINVY